MTDIAVVYWSDTGNTEEMAKLVAEGIASAGGSAVLIGADSFGPADVEKYGAIAFGCPAMGDEVLEEDIFEPMFSEVEGKLSGKRIGLLSSPTSRPTRRSPRTAGSSASCCAPDPLPETELRLPTSLPSRSDDPFSASPGWIRMGGSPLCIRHARSALRSRR